MCNRQFSCRLEVVADLPGAQRVVSNPTVTCYTHFGTISIIDAGTRAAASPSTISAVSCASVGLPLTDDGDFHMSIPAKRRPSVARPLTAGALPN